MRQTVVYVVEWDAFAETGVLRKVSSQIETWRKLGEDAILFVVSPRGRGVKPVLTDGHSTIFPFVVAGGMLGKVSKAVALQRVAAAITPVQPRCVFYRQSSWTPGLARALTGTHKLIVEVNSLDLEESRSSARGRVRGAYYRATRRFVNGAADAFICVSEEIAATYREYGKPVTVIANGFDCSKVTQKVRRATKAPHFVFVGTAGLPWHGIDKIVKLAERVPTWTFHVVGEKLRCPPQNINSYGALSWGELQKVYALSDFGISTLALHRKGMHEASPLKSREYLAHGLPVIGAYRDTDLSGSPFYLELDNHEDNIQRGFASICSFVEKWNGLNIDQNQIAQLIDWSAKEARRMRFMRMIALSS